MFGSKVKRLQKAGDVDGLLELFSSPEAKTRADAANALIDVALSETRRDECFNRLRMLASDVEPGVRGQAVYALWVLGSPDAADICLRALDDQDWLVRLFAATGSGQLGDRRAVSRLIQLMGDRESLVRQNVYGALAGIGDRSALTAMDERVGEERDRGAKDALREAIDILERVE